LYQNTERNNTYEKNSQLYHRPYQTPAGNLCFPQGLSQVITTFDIRMTSPNEEPVMNTAELHAMEHLAATFLRNHAEFGSKIIYWGPMGCRTGNYLLLAGDYESKDIVPLMTEMFEFIRDFEGEIPGASAKDCGNYLDMNLGMAKYLADKYLREVLYDIKPDRLVYPE
jgi:S-ribosylhomocysteine lyase